MKQKHQFGDEVSSKINLYEKQDSTSRKILKTRKDSIGSKTTWKSEDNVTSIILPDEKLPNNVTSYITDKAYYNNVTSKLISFGPLPNNITTDIVIFHMAED